MRTIPLLITLAGCVPASASPTAPTAPEATVSQSLYDMTLPMLDGTTLDGASLRGQAVLFVNVASKCGFTPQYEGLQALYEAKHGAGLQIIGVPCNQFGGQEPGDSEAIASFCKMNYGVTFPLLAKQKVNGPDRSPLYQWLVGSDAGGGANIKWNFEKFLVSPAGEVVGRWGSKTTPSDAELTGAIDKVLPPEG